MDTFDLNWLDYCFIGIISLSTLISLVRGFVREALSLITWALAAWISIRYATDASSLLAHYIDHEKARIIISGVGLFIIVLLLGALMNLALYQVVSKSGMGGTDRLIGLFFGAARGLLLVTVVILLMTFTKFTDADGWKKSILVPHFEGAAKWMRLQIPDYLPETEHKEAITALIKNGGKAPEEVSEKKESDPINSINKESEIESISLER